MRIAPTSLRSKLALGAALLCLTTLTVAALSVWATDRMSRRLDAALSAEARVARYAELSTEVSSFIVIAAETVQSGLPAADRAARLDTLAASIAGTFARLRADLGAAVEAARALGLDEASRRATQSLGIARMEAQFDATLRAFTTGDAAPERLRGTLDAFATGFDPLLNGVVAEEIRARTVLLDGIDALRRQLTLGALALSGLAVLAALAFYAGLVRPQFRRIDMVVEAARRIGQEDFAVTLPDTRPDEIGRLMEETARAAAALRARRDAVDAEWRRLSDTVAARTADLRAANDRLARVDGDRRRFFADISHELRTPLTVIAMEAEIGRAAGGDTAAAFATIQSRAAGLNRRIDDLLRIARSDTGRLALEDTALDLAAAARSALEETGAILANAGLTVAAVPDGPLPCRGDPNWLRQVIATLIANAARHAKGGRLLALDGAADAGTVRLAVIDNGPGLPAEADVFDRFAQGAGPGRGQGFGIGLALARWVVEAHGGTLTLTSPVPPGRALGTNPGTMVDLSLPADPR